MTKTNKLKNFKRRRHFGRVILNERKLKIRIFQMNWIEVAQYMVQWRDFIKTAMTL
jgi:hypothetical protein